MSISERIKEIIEYKSLNNRSFAAVVYYSDVAIGKIVKGENEPKFKLLQTLLITFPEINARWLMTGQGSMLVSDDEFKFLKREEQVIDDLIHAKIDSRIDERISILEVQLKELLDLKVRHYLKNIERRK